MKLKDRYPQLYEAYKKLLDHQSGLYLAQREWLENPRRIGEIIKAVLIKSRTNRIKEYEEFLKIMEQTRIEISSIRTNQQDLFNHK